MFYSLWYKAPKLLPAGSLESGNTDQVFGMKDVAEQHPSYRTLSASAFQATGRQQRGCIILQAVKHSLALLKMGKKLSETC